jgi:hypothetical protein
MKQKFFMKLKMRFLCTLKRYVKKCIYTCSSIDLKYLITIISFVFEKILVNIAIRDQQLVAQMSFTKFKMFFELI